MTQSGKDIRTRAVRIMRQRLENLERAGVQQLPKFRPGVDLVAKPQADVAHGPKSGATPLVDSTPAKGPAVSAEQRPAALDVICREVAACTRCAELAGTRTQTVFGVGNPSAQICFIGEAPGADEDRQGEPFVGRAGQLLTKMIQACRLKREDVYILNVLKCRPPGNRNPLPDEVANCRGFFERQLAIVRPKIICCLGAVAARSLLNTEESIGRLRGRFHDFDGIPVICTYHPAYLLRNPAAKVDAWEDLKTMMRKLGVEL